MKPLPGIPERLLTAQEFIQITLAPVSEKLSAGGARHMLVGYLPDSGLMTFISNTQGEARKQMLLALASALTQQAEQLDKPPASSLILPPGVKAS